MIIFNSLRLKSKRKSVWLLLSRVLKNLKGQVLSDTVL